VTVSVHNQHQGQLSLSSLWSGVDKSSTDRPVWLGLRRGALTWLQGKTFYTI